MPLLARHGKSILVIGGLIFVLFFILFPIFNRLLDQGYGRLAQSKMQTFEQSLSDQLADLAQRNRMLARSVNLPNLIVHSDANGAASFLNDAARQGREELVLTDAEGAVLARSNSPVRGDQVLETTAWGHVVASGMSVSTFDASRDFPLVMVAGSPVAQNGTRVGAILSEIPLDNGYAADFKEQHLKAGANIVFYSKENGVTGMSFTDDQTRRVLASFFNTGSDWVQKGESGREVLIEGRYYLIQNAAFPGIGGSPGGALIFLEVRHVYLSLLLSTLLTLVFLLSVYLVSRARSERDAMGRPKLILGVCGLILFVVTFLINQSILKQRALELTAGPYKIYNSTLELEPGYDVFRTGMQQAIEIQISTGGEAVNAVGVGLDYDPALVQVDEIVTENSFCDSHLFLEQKIDNQQGRVTVACGLPTPGFSGKIGTVAAIIVRPLKEGVFTLRFNEDTQVLANDGLGTNVLRTVRNGSYQTVAAVSEGSTALPHVLIFSPSHSNAEVRYKERQIQFSWPAHEGYTYAYLLDTNPNATSSLPNTTVRNDLNLTVNADGTYHLHVAVAKDGALGPIATFKVQVDSTPPAPPLIRASATDVKAGDLVRFEFGKEDKDLQPTYYVRIDDGMFLPSKQELYVPFLDAGLHKVTVRVFDLANNASESAMDINVRGPSLWERIINIDFQSLFR